MPTPQAPCNPAPCAAGVQPTPQAPCSTPGGQGPGPGGPGNQCGPPPGGANQPGGTNPPDGNNPPDGGNPPGDPNQPGQPGGTNQPGGQPGGCGAPEFMPSFLSRVWRFNGDADNYDAAKNVLNMTITKVLNLPKRFGSQDDDIVDQDAYVVFGEHTKVFDKHGDQLPRESQYNHALDVARTVKVSGKIMPTKKWQKDEDDQPVTTIRAKQVTITS